MWARSVDGVSGGVSGVNKHEFTNYLLKVSSKWDRSEQVNITTKEFIFECFKLTVW